MAGHSKWSNIKHKKAAVDQKRGKIFTKLIRELVVAAKGGGEPADNPTLRAAIDKALSANMKRDTIDKAIARGSGNTNTENYEEAVYEGYGANGTAFIVECLTDNKNRTVAEVRHLFSKHGGNLGVAGSVLHQFKTIGQIIFDETTDAESLLDMALELGVSDVLNVDNYIELQTEPVDFLAIKTSLIAKGYQPEYAAVNKIAQVPVELSEEQTEKAQTLIDSLEELDDVQNVFANIV